MNNPHGLVLATEGGTGGGVIFPKEIVTGKEELSEDDIFRVREGWIVERERKVRKFSKAPNTNEGAVSSEGKGVFILKIPGTRGDNTMAVTQWVTIKYLAKNPRLSHLGKCNDQNVRGVEQRLRYRDSSS